MRPDVAVVGLEIDPERVVPDRDGVRFARGGFEVAGLRPTLVRAFNVLRQYPESEVAAAWATMQAGLAPRGLIVDGTCDELGRRCAWILLDAAGPRSLTLAWDPFDVERPSDVAERLPKALIHTTSRANRSTTCSPPPTAPGPPRRRTPPSARVSAGGRRWRAALAGLRDGGVPVRTFRRRMRDCVLEVPWIFVSDPA